jgi:propanol-preferring alcohol dehydrogenase
MRAWALSRPGSIEQTSLALREVDDPVPGSGQIVIDVSVCGICRTDLHVVAGELPPHRRALIPGHQIVGRVRALGDGARRFAYGQRVGIAWLWRACGVCEYCAASVENLCRAPRFTGWDEDGGFAERACVPEDFAYALPDALDDITVAPLLCAGIIGYRSLRRSGIRPGGRLGLYGFGSSAHIALQVARTWGCRIFVVTREATHRALARELGAEWAGDLGEPPPERLDGAVLFAPVGTLVPVALGALRPGGTLACAGIHMSEIPPLDYAAHLFEERTLTSVTANTRADPASNDGVPLRQRESRAARAPAGTHRGLGRAAGDRLSRSRTRSTSLIARSRFSPSTLRTTASDQPRSSSPRVRFGSSLTSSSPTGMLGTPSKSEPSPT